MSVLKKVAGVVVATVITAGAVAGVAAPSDASPATGHGSAKNHGGIVALNQDTGWGG
jgi:hypothetical protein